VSLTQQPTRTPLLTLIAMLAFAANSLLCRMALGEQQIDAASFTAVRVLSGALTLTLFMLPHWRRGGRRSELNWRMALMLFAYMIFFSFAYLSLSAGTGALLLFGAVQLTMILAAWRAGERFTPGSWLGLLLAVAGLVYLVSPGITAPDPIGAVLMLIAGLAWGLYSLLGRHARNPLEATAHNFLLAVPLAIATSVIFIGDFHISARGLGLAVASGAVASGLGYVVWYAALRGLTSTRAATVQLSVPVIAAIGGVLLLSEPVTLRLVLASAATLGGIALVLLQRTAPRR
jgi:drug/metabolite transporter (DMT)-like permease